MNEYVLYNGQLLTKEEVQVSPFNRGMMYGDGCFDTLRSYKGKFLHLEDHFKRTKAAAEYLGMDVVFDFKNFKSKLVELIEANDGLNGDTIIRVQCWREGDRGYTTNSVQANWLTSIAPIQSSKKALKLATVQTKAIPSMALERKFKLSNGLNYIMAAKEASDKGADDALMFTIDEKISETTIANIFWVKGNTIFTPSSDCDLFPGITRNVVIEQIRKSSSAELKEGEFGLEDLRTAEAVFVTNSVKEIQKVSAIDDFEFESDHKLVEQFILLFQKYKSEHLI